MEDFMRLFNVFVFVIGAVVLFFFKENTDLLYIAAGLLWIGVAFELLFRKRLPKIRVSIRRPWAAKVFAAVMIIDTVMRTFEPGATMGYNPSFLLVVPVMVIGFLDRSQRIYIYDEGIVSGEKCMEFSRMESVAWKKEGISFELILRYEGKDISMEIPPVKVDELAEAFDNEGVLVMNPELIEE